jgi:hypothetical protein
VDVMRIYNVLDACAGHLNAAIFVIHHASKGSQSGKDVIDVGAGAGSQSRSADNHIILRPHEEDGAVVMEARLRSWKSPEPLCLRWNYPAWTPAPELDPNRLKRDPSRGGRPLKDRAATKPETAEPWTPERFASEFVTSEPKRKDSIASRASRAGLTDRAIKGFLAECEESGLIFSHPIGKTTGRAFSTVAPAPKPDGARDERERAHTPRTPRGKRRQKTAVA